MARLNSAEKLLERERGLVATMLWMLIVAALSGIATHIVPGHAAWQQWSYLVHSFVSLGLTLCLLPYTYIHFQRTLGVRRPVPLLSGIFTVLVVFLIAGTGLHIMIFGQSEKMRWLYFLHVYASYGGLALLSGHLLAHRFSAAGRTRGQTQPQFRTLNRAAWRATGKALLIVVVSTAGVSAIIGWASPAYRTGPAIEPYEMSYGDHPFRPSQTETTAGGHFVDARLVAGSDRCGSCHRNIFEEWKSSMHSQAASDRAYMTNIDLLAANKGMAATRYCEGCHAPVALLSGQLTSSGKHAGIVGTIANKEGVGCRGCHGIRRVVHLKGVASYEFDPAKGYLFADRDSAIATKIHNFLIRIHPQEHRGEMSRDVLTNPQLCATCHAQFMDKDMNNWGWVKMQDEYSAWLNSQYSGQSAQSFARIEAQRCQDCHMPLVAAADPSANAAGQVRSHRTLGANTIIPWFNGDKEQQRRVKEFLQSGKIHVTIDPPWRKDAVQSGKFVRRDIRALSETPSYFYLGESVRLKITVTNTGVGHDFPGGTTDINEVWISFRVVDAEGYVVYESGALQDDNSVDSNAHFYRSIPVDRTGKVVWRHDLFNMVGDSYKKSIPAGSADVVEYSFAVPYWAKGPLTVSAVVRYRKFNNRYAVWALKLAHNRDVHRDIPIVDMARDAITVPLRIKPRVSEESRRP